MSQKTSKRYRLRKKKKEEERKTCEQVTQDSGELSPTAGLFMHAPTEVIARAAF